VVAELSIWGNGECRIETTRAGSTSNTGMLDRDMRKVMSMR
jgi:hypothetical protein